jgi:hypothetical protein
VETGFDARKMAVCGKPSMGPPPFDGGNLNMTLQRIAGSLAFNGATAFRRWKQVPRHNPTVTPTPLQWGHRLSTVETGFDARKMAVCGKPSMGPPPFDGGNLNMTLQRIAGSLAMCGGRFGWREGLQWGHRLSTVETSAVRRPPTDRHNPSMGPPPFDGGNHYGNANTCGNHRLQWGHRLSTVETTI